MASSMLFNPDMDRELLEIWSEDPALSFCSDDQDLIIADTQFPLLLEFYLSKKTAPEQKAWLMSAMLVKLDNDNFQDDSERKETMKFLKDHQSQWDNGRGWPYLVKRVKARLKQ